MARRKRRNLRTRLIWSGVAAGSALVAVAAVQGGTRAVWKLIEDDEMPDDPAQTDMPWGQALAWAIGTGAAAAAARLLAQRGAAIGWTRVTGTRPPTM